jgi:predicted MFS family arabinose efflux permease
LSSEASANPNPSAGAASRPSVFAHPAFTIILIANSVSNIGIAMFDTSMSWLMTNLNPDPMMVSAVQVATMLPMFLLTLPAGAFADIFDARRLLIGSQAFVAAVSIVFALLVSFRLASPSALLLTTFVLGAGGALAAPTWLLITPMLVPKEDLDSAIAINNTSFNVSRAIGPAIAGFAIATVSLDIPFWCYCAGNIAVLGALLWWRAPLRQREALPAERLVSALAAGIRYTRYNRDIDSTLMRAVAFFLFSSAYWALLPLIARTQLNNGPETYGILLGMVGAGSIAGSFVLTWLKERFGPDGLAAIATFGTVVALALFAWAHDPVIACAASLIAGASWIIMLTTLFVSAQVALPEWVRGRGLAIYLTVYFGAMTAGSAIWGKIASLEGISTTLYIAAGGAVLGFALTARRKLQTGAVLDLTPAMHWTRPVFARSIEDDEGPILISIEYRTAPDSRPAFLAALQAIGNERRRDGAYAWNAFEDTADLGRVVEIFLIQSLLELKHLRARVTQADRLAEQNAHQYLSERPVIHFLLSPRRAREKKRKGSFFAQRAAAE